jgi:20S proteasome subunit alpha 3
MEAITQAGTCVGVLTPEGIVLGAQKRVVSKLLETKGQTEKMYKLDQHMLCAVAGITADANILVNYARSNSQQYLYSYQEPCPVEQLVKVMCDLKQGYTQYGGQRPFGVSFLYAGWDKHLGFQLYTSDPSGNYGGWRAFSVGAGKQAAESILKTDFNEGMTLEEGKKLVIKVLSKTIDSTSLNSEVVEFATLALKDGKLVNHIYTAQEVDEMLADIPIEKEEE